MTLSIKDDMVSQEARELAREAGESITEAVRIAVRERRARLKAKRNAALVLKKMEAIRLRIAKMPIYDDRTADEILGYDENGLPT